jgi:hypothetical protein
MEDAPVHLLFILGKQVKLVENLSKEEAKTELEWWRHKCLSERLDNILG